MDNWKIECVRRSLMSAATELWNILKMYELSFPIEVNCVMCSFIDVLLVICYDWKNEWKPSPCKSTANEFKYDWVETAPMYSSTQLECHNILTNMCVLNVKRWLRSQCVCVCTKRHYLLFLNRKQQNTIF